METSVCNVTQPSNATEGQSWNEPELADNSAVHAFNLGGAK